ncbi:hypothetical protein [Dactylosporangium sp. NPDC049140]
MPSYVAASPSPRCAAMIWAATTAACLSATTPALGVPTLVASPTA